MRLLDAEWAPAAFLVSALAAGLCGSAAVALPAEPPAGTPRVYLSWNAPYGMPRADSVATPACADSTRRDTLYISFEPTQYESTFVGVGGDLYIYPQPGDTLGSFWDVGRGGANHMGMVATLGLHEDMPEPTPWNAQGSGSVAYFRTPTHGRFRFGSVIGMQSGMPLEKGTRYVAGRVILSAKRPGLSGCDRPVCIEWRSADFLFGPRREIFPTYEGAAVVRRGEVSIDCGRAVRAAEPADAGKPFKRAPRDSTRRRGR